LCVTAVLIMGTSGLSLLSSLFYQAGFHVHYVHIQLNCSFNLSVKGCGL